jgi:DNA-binding transcriptional LysR family regulator
VTQAAISQRIQGLEKVVGVPLFQRQGGQVFLTEAGHRLYPFAQRILGLHQEALRDVTGRQQPLVGELELAASSIPGEHLLPGLLARFRERHPHVQVKATVTDSRTVLSHVERGRSHLGLVGGKGDSPHLDYRFFAGDSLVLAIPAGHPLGRLRRVRLKELSDQPLILREAGSGSRWCLEKALAQAGKSIRDLSVAMELGSNEAIKEAVQRGLGLALLSTLAIQKEIQAGQLQAVPVADLALDREMFAVWDRRRVLPIPARLFLDLLGPRSAAAAQT